MNPKVTFLLRCALNNNFNLSDSSSRKKRRETSVIKLLVHKNACVAMQHKTKNILNISILNIEDK